jgi:predicted transcriptional regulator
VVREKTVRLTKFELEVMHILWDLRSASVKEIQEQLPEKTSRLHHRSDNRAST